MQHPNSLEVSCSIHTEEFDLWNQTDVAGRCIPAFPPVHMCILACATGMSQRSHRNGGRNLSRKVYSNR
jgi:hypothetical protein